MKRLCFLLVAALVQVSSAQFTDDFSDGEIYTDPTWSGTDTNFVVDNGWLRSKGPQAASTLYLSTPNTLFDSAVWEILVRLDFNPTTSNFVKVYLASSQANLSSALNGYYLYFGNTGNSDTLFIYKQSGTTATKIFTAPSAIMTSTSTNRMRIKIERRSGGIWSVFADPTGGTNYSFQGNFTDNSITVTSYFGIVCTYSTVSRYNQFYFDDIKIDYITPDLTKPFVTSVSVTSSTTVDVRFSESVSAATAQNHVNYVIDNGVGNPISAVLDGADAALVHLTLLDPLTNATNYSISISGVKDIAGNAMLPATIQFSYYEPGPYDVLINEIMADPTPAVGLAAVEFVELYNRTPYAINIGGWKFSDASTTVTLPPHTIPADSFVVLIANSNKDSLPPGVSALGLSSLPSLNNTSDNLTLQNAAGIVIHKVNYVDDWYNHPVKSDGGWTLELINPQSPCQSTNNWTASNDPSGGTPGRRNSVYNPNATATFSLTGVIVSSPNEITLLFNQNVSPAAAAQVSNFTITPANATLQSSALDTTDFAQVHLYFATPLDVSTLYTVSVNIQNCAGQTLSTNNTYQFAVPQPADEFDVIINEIFPDPTPPVGLPEAEFIELFNRSNKAINLQNWELGKAGASTSAKLPYYLLMPDSFVIITANTNAMLFADYLNVLAVSSFPSLTNTGDNLLLKNNSGTLIHYVPYTDEWYQDENKKDGGWSLEMIDPGNPCYGKGNWQASSHPAGGTPGRKNSVVKFNPDTVLPKLVRAAISGPNTVMIYFSEPLDNGIASDPGKYVVDQNVGSPALALPVPYEYNTVQLEFLQPFSKGIIYTVSVSDVTDCNGNPIGMSNTARFAIPDTAAPGDVIINEILFNPRTGGYDFVELYNLSNKVIDLKQLEILEMDYEYPFSILEKSFLATESYLLFPQEYVVVTAKPENILQYYYCENPFALLAVKGFPNFDDNESICVLRLINNATIDSLAYRDDWHFALLDKEDGVSLERTSFDAPTQQSSSWHSAASTVGFATPTYMNSQFASDGFHDDAITISPEVFTPDNDGDKDFTLIEYQFDEPGYVCNITVFDAIGREIKSLVRNELLSASGKFKWDGTDNEGRKARIGIYIVYAEVFNLQGKVKRFKNQVVLGGKLNE